MKTQEERVKAKLEQLSGVHSRYIRLQKCIDGALELGLLDIDGEFLDALWAFQNYMMKDGDLNWLEWHIMDNDNGSNEALVTFEGGSAQIKSLSDLATMLVAMEVNRESN